MSAYTPSGVAIAVLLAGLLIAALVLGFALQRLRSPRAARAAAWALVVCGAAAVERITVAEPPGVRMLALIAILLYGMKAVVAVEAITCGAAPLGASAWLAFAAAWPGMRPSLFAVRRGGPLPDGHALLRRGFSRGAAGLLLLALARAVGHEGQARLLGTVLALPALSLVLHFGIFDVAAGSWRRAGFATQPLFRAPFRATSLGEFWGRRWNLAFSEMTAACVYRPLRGRLGRPAATLLAFLVSGLLHEVAISLPVDAGFGLPTSYFLLHGGLVIVERALAGAGRPIDRAAGLGRAWTAAWLVLPLPVLFHRPFLAGVVWPLLE